MINENYGAYALDAWAEQSLVSNAWRPHARISRLDGSAHHHLVQTFDTFITAYPSEAEAELFARFEARRLIDRKIAGLEI